MRDKIEETKNRNAALEGESNLWSMKVINLSESKKALEKVLSEKVKT